LCGTTESAQFNIKPEMVDGAADERLTEAERALLRSDLSKYLEEYRTKVGSDGEQLVHYPANFDLVADAMNRSDLTSVEEKPWSKYLLSGEGNFEDALDKEGRYHNVLATKTEELKYDRGMAQIQLYDKQLLEISRRAARVKAALRIAQVDAGSEDVDDSDNMSTGRGSKKSTFFLTRGKFSESTTPRSETHSSEFIPEGEKTQSEQVPENDSPERQPSSGQSVGSTSSSARDAIRENIQAVHRGRFKSSLSADEELRLQTLLDIDETGEAWQALCKYGFRDSQTEQNNLLDQELRRYQRPEFLNIESLPTGKALIKTTHELVDRHPDYLTTQRENREQNSFMVRLDSMIRSYSTQKVELSGLVDPKLKSCSSGSHPVLQSSVHSTSSVFLSLPEPSRVDVNRVVTVKDIEEAVFSSKQVLLEESKSQSDFNLSKYSCSERNRGESQFDLSLVSHSDSLCGSSNCSLTLAPRQEIDRLLSSLRFEVQRLGELRSRSSDRLSTNNSNSTPRLLRGSTWQNISPTVSELEDQMEKQTYLESDIFARYGIENRRVENVALDKSVTAIRHGASNDEQKKQIQKINDAFLPLIGDKQSMYGASSSSSLPLIAESFRKKVSLLKAQRGLLQGDEDLQEENPPPRPPSRDKRKIVI